MRSVLLAVLIGTGLLAAGCNRSEDELTVSGRVEIDTIHIGSKIGGRVLRVNADEGDDVAAGKPIVELERQELDAQLAQAVAAQAQSQAQLDLLLAGTRKEDLRRAEAVVQARRADLELRRKGFRDEEVREAEAQLASARSNLDNAKKELDRSEGLFKSRAIDEREVESRRNAFAVATAAADVANERATMMRSGSRPEEISAAEAALEQSEADLERLRNGARPEEIAAARAAVESARANVDRIKTQLDETSIGAPADVVVETLDLKPGDLVKAGETLGIMQMKDTPWVRCYVPERNLGHIKTGMTVEVTVDSFPGKRFQGKVRRVSTEAEFTPRNVQTTEKRAELVFETKVDITGDATGLRSGMFADVHLDGAGQAQ